jgi:superfamily II DNA or RNA helicase
MSDLSLRHYQTNAVNVITSYNRGLIVCPTGGGKTRMMVGIYNKIQPQLCLILVPTSVLVTQTENVFNEFAIGDGYKYVVSTWQGVMAQIKSGEQLPHYNMVLADESHRVGEDTNYYSIIDQINPDYLYAVTATPMRFDSIKPLEKLCDNHKHTIPIDLLYREGYLVRPSVKFVKTNFSYDVNNLLTNFERTNFSFEQKLGRLKSYLGKDVDRNNFLISFLSAQNFNCALVLSYTTEQTELLYEQYKPKSMLEEKHMIHGKLGVKAKREFFKTIESQTNFVIFATQSFLGEGFDLPKLDSLFLATPFGGGAKTIQFAGRILRPFQNKTFVSIYDFVDDFGELGSRWASSRKARYDLLLPRYDDVVADNKVLSIESAYKELAELKKDFEIKYNWLDQQPLEVQAEYVDKMLELNYKIRMAAIKVELLL